MELLTSTMQTLKNHLLLLVFRQAYVKQNEMHPILCIAGDVLQHGVLLILWNL